MKLLKFTSILTLFLLPFTAFAQSTAESTINRSDSAWLIVATSLVLLMTPALAIFYGGLVKRKNVLNTMILSFVCMGVVSLTWALLGFSLSFGESTNGFIGNFTYLLGQNLSLDTPYGTQTVPLALFMLFQMKFAIITPALVSGAVAERIKFSSFVLFTALWSVLIYAPLACWVWNPNGWLAKLGALDFAGGTVVHLASGVTALALLTILGPRKESQTTPNNLTLTLLGAGMLWFGWFGFNAGSALAMDAIAVNAFLTTHLAAAAAMIAWMLVESFTGGKPSAIGCASGLVAGLVAITPAAGFVGVGPAILIGLAAGTVCCFGIKLKHKLKLDDALDVIGIHGIGGILGAILTGVFADPKVNPIVSLEAGRGTIILNQVISVVAVGAFAFIASWLLGKAIEKTIGLRSNEGDESLGLDLAYHGESGYDEEVRVSEILGTNTPTTV
jgi:ammonium transporter, Amt family